MTHPNRPARPTADETSTKIRQLWAETMAEAEALVICDQRQSYGPDEMTDAECLAHVRATIAYGDVWGNDDLAVAYRLVIMDA